MDLRKELIDFGNELQKIGFNSFDSVEMVVDIYLKSINLSDCERQTVSNNEQFGNICPKCKGTGKDGHDRSDPPDWYICDKCNGKGQI